MTLVFLHHQEHGPLSLTSLWDCSHGYAGSVARLRVLFWLAQAGHKVYLAGNVLPGEYRGVTAIPSAWDQPGRIMTLAGPDSVLILNDPPPEPCWQGFVQCFRNWRLILWPVGLLADPWKWLQRAKDGQLERIVCISTYHRELYRMYPGFELTDVCYLGVDLDIMNAIPQTRPAKPTVVFCSVPRRTKGFHHLLAAWGEIRKAVPTAELRVMGSADMHAPHASLGQTNIIDEDIEEAFPQYFSRIPESLQANGITLLGRSDLRTVYREIRSANVAIVNCNWRGSVETFCRSAVEIQCAGVPVVGSTGGSLPEVVSNHVSGILVSSVGQLHRAVRRILQDPALEERLGAAGPVHVSQMGEYDRVVNTWDRILNGVSCTGLPTAPSRHHIDVVRKLGMYRLRQFASLAARRARRAV